jgi:hypothetical protein
MKYSTIRNDRVGTKAETAEVHHDHVRCPDFTDLILPPLATSRPGLRSFAVNTLTGCNHQRTWVLSNRVIGIGNGHDGDQFQDRE